MSFDMGLYEVLITSQCVTCSRLSEAVWQCKTDGLSNHLPNICLKMPFSDGSV